MHHTFSVSLLNFPVYSGSLMPNNITEAFRKAHCGKTSIPLGKEVCAFFFFFFEDLEVQKSTLTQQLKMQQDLIDRAIDQLMAAHAAIDEAIRRVEML